MEFTVEDGTLYMLQTRTSKRTPSAAFRMAVDMANEEYSSPYRKKRSCASSRRTSSASSIPVIDTNLDKKSLESRILGTGINAVPGAAVGKVVFTAHDAEDWAKKGDKVILVRRETSPEDVRWHGRRPGES